MKTDVLSYPQTISTPLGPVKIYCCRNGFKTEYVVNWSIAKQRKREKFADELKALNRAQEVAKDLSKGRIERTAISPADIAEFMAAKQLLSGGSLLRAAEFFVESNTGLVQKTVKEVCEHHLAEIAIGSSERHKATTKWRHGVINEVFENRIISSITRDEIIDFLKKAKCRSKQKAGVAMSGKSKNNLANAFGAVWNHAQTRMSALPKNMPHAATELPTFEESREKRIYTPEQMTAILHWLEDEVTAHRIPKWVLATVAIKAFTGIRTAEIERLQWEDVRADAGTILLHRGLTKTQEGRILPIRPALNEWLQLCAKRSGKVAEDQFFTYTKKIAEGVFGKGAPWEKNALRHSFISYSMAETGNAATTADISGNSIRMVKAVYQTLAVPSDAHKYFNIEPKRGVGNLPS